MHTLISLAPCVDITCGSPNHPVSTVRFRYSQQNRSNMIAKKGVTENTLIKKGTEHLSSVIELPKATKVSEILSNEFHGRGSNPFNPRVS